MWTEIESVRTDLKSDIAEARTELGSRMSSVEGKLDLINALNIQAAPAEQ